MEQKNVSNARLVMNGISTQTIITLIIGLLEIVVFSVMSRLLSKEDFGYFAALTAVTSIFESLSEAGVGASLVQKKDFSDGFKNTAFTLSAILGVGFAVILCLLSGTLSTKMKVPILKTPFVIMSLTLVFHNMSSISFACIKRKLQFLKLGFIGLISLIVSSSIAIILAAKGYGLYAILTRVVLGSFISLVLSYALCQTSFRFQFEKSHFKSILNFGGWLTGSVIVRNLSTQADKLLMTSYLSVASLGAYNRPKDFINNISGRLNGIFDPVLFPILSKIQDAKSTIQNAFRISITYMNIFSMLLALAFIVNAELIIRIFFGEQWFDLIPIFQILSIALIFKIDGRLGDCYLRSLALVKQQCFLRVLQLVLTAIGLLIGFHWDIKGVAIAVVIVNFINVVIKILYISKKIGISYGETIRTILDSWKFALAIFPIVIVVMLLVPHNVLGEIVILLTFSILVLLVFLLFPQFVGRLYHENVHGLIMDIIKGKKRIRG